MTHLVGSQTGFKEDVLVGFCDAYSRYVERIDGAAGVQRRGGPFEGKVAVVVGGGSGHYPAFLGYVGRGVADAAVVGDVFTAPSARQVYEVIRATEGGAGVLCLFGNYAGDMLNFGAAKEWLGADGIDCRLLPVTDDVASAPLPERELRRGVAGMVAVFKVAGAGAAKGMPLDEVERIARKANQATSTFGIAFRGCTLPGGLSPLFDVPDGVCELGLGIHGEPGIESVPMPTAYDAAELLVEKILTERPTGASRAAVLLNGLGATKYEELFTLWNEVSRRLTLNDVVPVLPEVGELITSIDMAGCSLSVCWLDDELLDMWSAPADAPGFRRGNADALPTFGRRAPFERANDAGAWSGQQFTTVPEPVMALREALARVLVTLVDSEAELGALDAIAGDGDHGTGMTRGMRAAVVAAEAAPPTLATTLQSAGRAFADAAGGTSGLLWGLMLEAAGTSLSSVEEPGSLAVGAAVHAAAEVVQRVGNARLGDKTLVDVLVPFDRELSEQIGRGTALGAAWVAAADVACDAARATAELTPRVGRARPLASRSVGHPDPGAMSLSRSLTTVSDLLMSATEEGRNSECHA